MENEKNLVVSNNNNIKSFDEMNRNSNTTCDIYTNIEDDKKIFNLENKVDYLLNDCENELIRIKEVLIKIYHKPLAEPVYDEETGEVLKEYETTMSCVLVDSENKSYATGSKIFTMQLIRYIRTFGLQKINEGLEIKIVKNKMQNSNNKCLGFELV